MKQTSKIKVWLCLFIAGLLISGLTAFPLEWELEILDTYLGVGSSVESTFPDLAAWITKVHQGLRETNGKYPFIAYGTDCLAFAHIVIAILFIGPLKDPVKNIWVIEFGIIACILIIPLALLCGHFRGIPVFWQVIDCSFGVFGVIPLLIVRRLVKQIEDQQNQ
jgi:hypothetical protein